MSKIVMEAVGLNRSYGSGATRTQALRDVSLCLHAGELTVLMGASGSGKSTLLAVLSGLLPPDEGEVIVLGQSLWGMSERARERFRLAHCGFIFQGFNLFPALTARDQLEMVLRWGMRTPTATARRRADDMLELLGIGHRARLRPAQLSGGEKQRVAIGRALIKNPDFCFADEPTSALDWEHGRQVVELLRTATREEDASVLLVTHDPRILPHADRVLRMEDGRLVEETIPEHQTMEAS